MTFSTGGAFDQPAKKAPIGILSMRKQSSVKYASYLVLAVWAGLLTVAVSSLMAGHWVSLPHPESGSRLVMGDEATDGPSGESIVTFHFLYSDCPCSRRVLNHVLKRKSLERANERLVLIGDSPNQQSAAQSAAQSATQTATQNAAESLGFNVDMVTPAGLMKRYGIEAAPLLVVTKLDGTILYSGGYTARKQGLNYRDVDVINRALSGETLDSLPLYGCAVSERLQSLIDPLSLKY